MPEWVLIPPAVAKSIRPDAGDGWYVFNAEDPEAGALGPFPSEEMALYYIRRRGGRKRPQKVEDPLRRE